MSLVTVCGESFAAQLLAVIIGGYKLCDPRESLGARRNVVAQIDQQITGLHGIVFAADCNRRFDNSRRVGDSLVRHKTAATECPQQFVKALRIATVACVDMNCIVEAVSLFCQSTRESLT
jgi:hypothetical protein